MRHFAKRLWVLMGLGLVAVPLSAAALAHACTGLATVKTAPSGVVGTTLTITGSGFAAHDPADARTEPARIRFDDPNGPVLASVSPSSGATGGNFTVTVTVPALAAGNHVLVATQNGSDGRPAYGTPARQAFEIIEAAAAPVAEAAAPVVVAAPAVEMPALSKPFVTPSRTVELRKAVAKCKSKFSVTQAKTKTGKKRMATKRSACIRSAKARLA